MIKRRFEIISCSIFSRFFAWSIFLFCLLYLSEVIIHSGSFPDPPSGELQPVLPYYLLIRCDYLCLFPCFEYPNRWDAFWGRGGGQRGKHPGKSKHATSPFSCLSKRHPSLILSVSLVAVGCQSTVSRHLKLPQTSVQLSKQTPQSPFLSTRERWMSYSSLPHNLSAVLISFSLLWKSSSLSHVHKF